MKGRTERGGKLVISGYYGFGNVGDEAILRVLVEELKARFRDSNRGANVEIVVLSAAPAETARRYGVRAVDRWSPFQIIRELRGASGFILGGGGLIQDRTSRRSAFYYLSLIALARRAGCPVFLVGQGLGPLRSAALYRWARRLLRGVEFAVVRDEPSATLLRRWGLPPERLAVGGDLTWLLRPRAASLPPSDEKEEGAFVAVALKGPRRRRERRRLGAFQEALAAQLDRLHRERNVSPVFLVFHPREDRPLAEGVAARMRGARDPLIVTASGVDVREVLACVGRAWALVGMRLHALIFSALMKRPFVALGDEPKLESFLRGLERAGGPALPHWTPDQVEKHHVELSEALARLDAQRPALEGQLERAGEALYEKTRRALDACWARLERGLEP